MAHQHRHMPTDRMTVTATVADLAAVQRVLMLVVGRRHAITRFTAEETTTGRWRVTLDCPVTGADPGLLPERLRRFPSVLTVTSGRGVRATQRGGAPG